MSIADPFIKRPVASSLLAVAVVLATLLAVAAIVLVGVARLLLRRCRRGGRGRGVGGRRLRGFDRELGLHRRRGRLRRRGFGRRRCGRGRFGRGVGSLGRARLAHALHGGFAGIGRIAGIGRMV